MLPTGEKSGSQDAFTVTRDGCKTTRKISTVTRTILLYFLERCKNKFFLQILSCCYATYSVITARVFNGGYLG